MDFDIKKDDKVVTADGREVGLANMLYIDPSEDNSVLEHNYLLVISFTSNKKYYIPVDQIESKQSENTVELKLTMSELEKYEREPEGVNSDKVQQEPLGHTPPVLAGEEADLD